MCKIITVGRDTYLCSHFEWLIEQFSYYQTEPFYSYINKWVLEEQRHSCHFNRKQKDWGLKACWCCLSSSQNKCIMLTWNSPSFSSIPFLSVDDASLIQAMSRSGLAGPSLENHMDMSHLPIPKHMSVQAQEEPSDLEELEQFAKAFKQRRIKLGFTQVTGMTELTYFTIYYYFIDLFLSLLKLDWSGSAVGFLGAC